MSTQFTDPADMHRAVDQKLRTDPVAEYYADFAVDATSEVNALVPTRNRRPDQSDEWLNRVLGAYGSVRLEGYDLMDPVILLEDHGLTDPRALAIDAPLPAIPDAHFCSRCTSWGEVSQVLVSRGVRVVALLLCDQCTRGLGVVTT